MLSTNIAKCSRIDKLNQSRDGRLGLQLKQQMEKRLEKIQEVKQAKVVKPLVLPDGTMKKKRGGKRLRSMKQKLMFTDARKLQNRINMDDSNQDYYMSDNVNIKNMNKLRIQMNQKNKVQLNKKQKQRLDVIQQQQSQAQGFISSIGFTDNQAMELVNPDQQIKKVHLDQQYFDKDGGFKTVLQQKQKIV